MVKSALVAMVIMGCDCDARMCEFISETPAQWSTVAECEAAVQHQTLATNPASYPLVTGICRTTVMPAPRLAALPESRRPIDLPATQSGKAGDSGVYYAGRTILERTANGYSAVRDTLGRAATGTASVARRASDTVVQTLAANF